MEISREKAASPAGTIRLRYSRQFQSGGHAHTVDAECLLPVGASQEMREQIVRELELNVEQLARQITQSGTRPTEATRPQAAAISSRPVQADAHVSTPSEAPRPAAPATIIAHTPVSESMPNAPATSGERKVRLPDFINAIKKHWDMSPQEAMKLLKVQTLDGLNYREVYNALKALVDRRNAETSGPSTPYNATRPAPIIEAPRSTGRGTPPAPGSHPPTNMMIMPRTQGQSAPHVAPQDVASTAPVLTMVLPDPQESKQRSEPEPGVDFAGSSKSPIPIQFGTVREITPRLSKFEEEEDDEEYDLPEEQAANHLSGKLKLDELKELRGNTAASAGRLKVLDNVIGHSADSDDQLQKIMQVAWGITTAKKLKTDQVEGLITWAKEDFFEDEVKTMLAWIADEEH